MINKLSSEDQNFTDQLNALTSWDNSSNNEVNITVKTIIDDVIKNGDQSVLDYTQKFRLHHALTKHLFQQFQCQQLRAEQKQGRHLP